MDRMYLYPDSNYMVGYPYSYPPGPFYYPILYSNYQSQISGAQDPVTSSITPKMTKCQESHLTESNSGTEHDLYDPKSALLEANVDDEESEFEKKKRVKHSGKHKKKSETLKYKKKNTESNISNQVFSFVCNKNKSKIYLSVLLKHLEIYSPRMISLFYSYASIVKRSKTKYMNKKIIGALCRVEHSGLFHQRLLESGIISPLLSIQMFGKLVRILVNKYLVNLSPQVLMTSKKIDKTTCLEHLERRRQMISYLKQDF